MARVYLGVGTNIGDREANLRQALARLRSLIAIGRVSRVYESEPVGYREQPNFWNLVVEGETSLDPDALLDRLKTVEHAMGRRPSFRGAPRVIDIDILLYEDRRIRTAKVEIPHPRMLQRAFVLCPLDELAPARRHPVTGRTIAEHLRSADDLERVRPLFPGARLLERPRGGEDEEGEP